MPIRHIGSFDQQAANDIIASDPWQGPFTQVAGDLVPSPSAPALYFLNKASAAAVTLGAPVANVDDGKCIGFASGAGNSQQHVITATGLLQTGSANVNTATFAAQPGCSVILMAIQGKWYVVSQVGVTFG